MAESEDPELTFFYRYTKIATTYRKTSYENDMNTSIEDSQLKRKTKRHNKIDRRSRDASSQVPHSMVSDS